MGEGKGKEYRKMGESIGKEYRNIEKGIAIMNDNSTTMMNNTTQSNSTISMLLYQIHKY